MKFRLTPNRTNTEAFGVTNFEDTDTVIWKKVNDIQQKPLFLLSYNLEILVSYKTATTFAIKNFTTFFGNKFYVRKCKILCYKFECNNDKCLV